MIEINKYIKIDDEELKFNFIRSSGPGGQNVNKVATAAQLRFNVMKSVNLTYDTKIKLLKVAGRRATSDGIIIIEAKRFRTQEKNKVDAIKRLVELIKLSVKVRKVRKKTKPSKATVQNRIDQKKKRSVTKKLRKKIQNINE